MNGSLNVLYTQLLRYASKRGEFVGAHKPANQQVAKNDPITNPDNVAIRLKCTRNS